MGKGIYDYRGLTFNSCLVIEPVIKDETGSHDQWKVKCYCGNSFICQIANLKHGTTKSCGCFSLAVKQSRRKDYRNLKFNGCLILNPVIEENDSSLYHWNVKCHCGKIFTARPDNIKSGVIKSCGCNRDKNKESIQNYHKKQRLKKGLDPNKRILTINRAWRSSAFISIRNLIKKIDGCCKLCGNLKNLLVHHIVPVEGKVNYEDKSTYHIIYDLNMVITLCDNCHLHEAHDGASSRLNEEIQKTLLAITKNRNIPKALYDEYKDKVSIFKGWINNV